MKRKKREFTDNYSSKSVEPPHNDAGYTEYSDNTDYNQIKHDKLGTSQQDTYNAYTD